MFKYTFWIKNQFGAILLINDKNQVFINKKHTDTNITHIHKK